MARKDYTVYDCFVDHRSPEYREGLLKLADWHNECRSKRLGIDEAKRKLASKGLLHEVLGVGTSVNRKKRI